MGLFLGLWGGLYFQQSVSWNAIIDLNELESGEGVG
jgi:hypothetical protein